MDDRWEYLGVPGRGRDGSQWPRHRYRARVRRHRRLSQARRRAAERRLVARTRTRRGESLWLV